MPSPPQGFVKSVNERNPLQFTGKCRVRQGLRLRKKPVASSGVRHPVAGEHGPGPVPYFRRMRNFRRPKPAKADCSGFACGGGFMGGGSVDRPKGDYHLELVTGNAAFAEKLLKIMRRFHLPAKTTDRKGDYLVYIKEGNGVSQFLQYIGAAQAYLKFESVRVVKGMRNNVNRVVNCETANLQKTVNTRVRQRRAVTYPGIGPVCAHVPEASGSGGGTAYGQSGSVHERAGGPGAGLTKSGLSRRFEKNR